MSIFKYPGIKQVWTPTVNAVAPMTYAPTSSAAEYFIIGEYCFINLFLAGTLGGVATNEVNATLPIPRISSVVFPIVTTVVNGAGPDYLGRGNIPVLGLGNVVKFYMPLGVNYNLGAVTILGQGFYRFT